MSTERNSQLKQNLKTLRKDDFINPDSEMFNQIVDYIDEKLNNGCGETLLQLDLNDKELINDDESNKIIESLNKICKSLNSDFMKLTNSKWLIRQKVEIDDFHEVRVSVLGNVDAGKSTLLSVLTHGQLDDGRGLARQKLFRHKHEIESGRTSSVGNDILGFDNQGNIVNTPSNHSNNLNWPQICEKSSKLLSLIDLCGHEKYLKTTIFGMTGLIPNYCMLMIGSNAGIIGSTKEHLGLTLALKVPLFVVVTKIDLTPPNVLEKNLENLQKVLKSTGCRKQPLMIQTKDDVFLAATNFSTSKLCPIFQISCVTGQNIDLLKIFLNLLSPKYEKELDNEPAEFQIDEVYSVAVGTVVSGLMLKGVVKTNDVLYLGPNKLNKFEPVVIKSIHRKRMPVKECKSGQQASFALKKVKKSDLRKGMVMLSTSLEPKSYKEIYAEILILHHPTTISVGYQAMVHCGTIRQTATIISMNNTDCLRTGDKAIVKLRFIKHGEYVRVNQSLIFREGRTKAIGRVVGVIEDVVSEKTITNKASQKKMRYQQRTQKNQNDENDDLNKIDKNQNKNKLKK